MATSMNRVSTSFDTHGYEQLAEQRPRAAATPAAAPANAAVDRLAVARRLAAFGRRIETAGDQIATAQNGDALHRAADELESIARCVRALAPFHPGPGPVEQLPLPIAPQIDAPAFLARDQWSSLAAPHHGEPTL